MEKLVQDISPLPEKVPITFSKFSRNEKQDAHWVEILYSDLPIKHHRVVASVYLMHLAFYIYEMPHSPIDKVSSISLRELYFFFLFLFLKPPRLGQERHDMKIKDLWLSALHVGITYLCLVLSEWIFSIVKGIVWKFTSILKIFINKKKTFFTFLWKPQRTCSCNNFFLGFLGRKLSMGCVYCFDTFSLIRCFSDQNVRILQNRQRWRC